MNRPFFFLLTATLLSALGPLSCGDDEGDCVSACQEAQRRDCTSITGDCGAFCDALFGVEDRSGCADERASYQSCLDEGDVCANSCSSRENDLSSCVGAYCFTHSSEAECQVLVSSF